MSRRRKGSGRKRRTEKKLWPVILISLAAGSLATLAILYSPERIVEEAVEMVNVFHISDSTPPPDTILIEVRNGAGVSDLAMRAQNFLETRSGQAVFYAPGPPLNAMEMDYEVTMVISHHRSFSGAMLVAEALGVGDSSVVMLLPPPGVEPSVDVSVILGRDRDDPSNYIPYRD
ncbi:hypothetical protein CSA37_03800 [Candidatus Fermentibacteria bacterium]|nr:MAG: hypothetical protein CSA37_03800 [Candidatus Fermentibacteria bacterium]